MLPSRLWIYQPGINYRLRDLGVYVEIIPFLMNQERKRRRNRVNQKKTLPGNIPLGRGYIYTSLHNIGPCRVLHTQQSILIFQNIVIKFQISTKIY